jgi:hypothetical protein
VLGGALSSIWFSVPFHQHCEFGDNLSAGGEDQLCCRFQESAPYMAYFQNIRGSRNTSVCPGGKQRF